MLPAEILDRLRSYQQRGLELMQVGGTLLHSAETPDLAGLSAVRWRLIRLLREYQLFKHSEVFDPAIAGENDTDAQLARLMKDKCLAIDRAFRDHVTQWSENTGPRWAEYKPAALAMRDRLLRHLEEEQADIKRLLHWEGQVSGRSAG